MQLDVKTMAVLQLTPPSAGRGRGRRELHRRPRRELHRRPRQQEPTEARELHRRCTAQHVTMAGRRRLKGEPTHAELDRHAEFSNTCYPVPSGNGIFEVHDREWHYVVDFFGKHCECRRWQLTGIPCSHAISCLKHERIPENSVLPNCYSIDAFKNAYGCNIFPCSEKSSWENVGGPEVQPPKYEKKVGRPPKARRRAAHEVQGPNGPRLSKYGVIIHCSHCGQAGHNSASCAAKKAGQPAVKKPKRPTVATTAEPVQQPSYE